jgi:hypothetical protein
VVGSVGSHVELGSQVVDVVGVEAVVDVVVNRLTSLNVKIAFRKLLILLWPFLKTSFNFTKAPQSYKMHQRCSAECKKCI